ncbi:MAG: homocysteine S-methyltransferase family protein [Geminicoccaceae bacterium]
MSEAMRAIEGRLSAGGVVLLDGATGTELQRRGAAMSDGAWCALATASRPDLLRAIHEDYIRAGADVITANTFASARHLMERAGHGELTVELLRRAVRLAREAVDATAGRPVAVAGSISTMRPVGKGTDQRALDIDLAAIPWADNLKEVAETLAEAGADLLLLEMISDVDYGMLALEAARGTGLPIWVGLSAKRQDGRLVSYRDDGPSFQELADHWARQPVEAVGIMHTAVPEIDEALDLLLARTTLPVMAYPEAGYFRSPDWNFVEVEPEAFAEAAMGWAGRGARILGGCCGLGPEHIAALSRRLVPDHSVAS